jgi:dTDP-4-dehydrorhamnose reductase
MANAAQAGKNLKVVGDQFGTPTYTVDLANQIEFLIHTPIYGTYHGSNSGICSWHDVAVETLKLAGMTDIPVAKIASSEWPTPVKRPAFSALVSYKLELLGYPTPRNWKEALADYVRDRDLKNA